MQLNEPDLLRSTATLAGSVPPHYVERRQTVLDNALTRVEVLSVAGLSRTRTPTVHSPAFQLLFPLEGAFNWHIGLSLADIGARLGVSPVYLTDAFRRSVGMPVSQYHRRLRLARALAELPHTDDITELALRFGFSSHAHFSTAFRSAFGRTPSEFRVRARRADIRSLLQHMG